jgi:hypothetical protein
MPILWRSRVSGNRGSARYDAAQTIERAALDASYAALAQFAR